MKKYIPLLPALFLLFVLFSCNKEDDAELRRMTVASKKSVCSVGHLTTCYNVKFKNSMYWESLYEYIEDFDDLYQEGYEYELLVLLKYDKNLEGMMDGSPYYYKILKIISIEQRDSEGL